MRIRTATYPRHIIRIQTMTKHTDHTHLGLWTYLMSDCVLFASLFAAYAVLHTATAGGPEGREIFDRSFVLIETVILLTSSFTAGIATLAAQRKQRALTWGALVVTFLLGLSFLGMELHEFGMLAAEGQSWQASAFLSSYFTLVGTHGLHIFAGLVWLLILSLAMAVQGLTAENARRIGYFSLFWHFLDIIWIFIFTIVYLLPFI